MWHCQIHYQGLRPHKPLEHQELTLFFCPVRAQAKEKISASSNSGIPSSGSPKFLILFKAAWYSAFYELIFAFLIFGSKM